MYRRYSTTQRPNGTGEVPCAHAGISSRLTSRRCNPTPKSAVSREDEGAEDGAPDVVHEQVCDHDDEKVQCAIPLR